MPVGNAENAEFTILEEVANVSKIKPDTIIASCLLKFSISHNYNTFGGEVSFMKVTNNPEVTEEQLQESVQTAAFKSLDSTVQEYKKKTKEIKQGIIESQK